MNRRRLVTFSAVVIGAMLLVSAWAWAALPAGAQVPIHWGVDGQADGFASKTVGLLLLPLVALGVAALLWAIPVIEPRRANLEKSGSAYAATWVAVMLLLAGIHAAATAAASGANVDVSLIVFTAVGVVFVVIGNYLPKVRPNYMLGIRTPWTLTSDLAWDRTHRVGGRLFVLEGIALIAIGLLRPAPEVLPVVLIGGVVVLVVVTFGYSYRVWRADPARRV